MMNTEGRNDKCRGRRSHPLQSLGDLVQVVHQRWRHRCPTAFRTTIRRRAEVVGAVRAQALFQSPTFAPAATVAEHVPPQPRDAVAPDEAVDPKCDELNNKLFPGA